MFDITAWLLNILPSWLPAVIVFTSVVTFLFASIANMLPGLGLVYKEAIKIVSILLFAFGFYLSGCMQYANHVKIQIQKEIQFVDKVKVEQVVVTKEVIKWYKEKQQTTGTNYENLKKEVNPKDDVMCTVPESFVRLHDSAAKNTFSDTSTGVAGATTKATDTTPTSSETSKPSGVPLSGVELTIINNYEQYYKIANQLEALQDWVKKEKAANP
jgi:hypothetical protein